MVESAGDTPVLSNGPLTGVGSGWAAPGWRTARSTESDPWAASGAAALGPSVAIDPSGGLAIDGLEWMGARVYDSTARGFLSVDPIDNLTQTFENNPYTYAGNDPVHAVDPAGLSPVTDQQLADYRSSNGIGGTFHSVTGAVGHWFKNNWEYVAGGAMVVGGGVLIATGVGGPVGMMLVSAGADTIVQKATTGHVDWGQVAISGVAGAIPGGGGVVGKVGAKALMATVKQGAISGAAGGSMSGAYGYARQPGPHSVAGFVGHTALGAAAGAGMGAAGGAAGHGLQAVGGKVLSKLSPTGCFVAGTDVLLADGSSKPIEDIETDDEVTAYNPETDQTEKRRVVRSYVHEDKPTYDVVVNDGEKVTATSKHPFMVEGKGYTPVEKLHKGDLLVRADGSTIEVLSVNATGKTATVYNFEVEGLHNYHVRAGQHWLLVHNTCKTPFQLKSVGDGDFETPEGLVYGRGSVHGHRITHVMQHAFPDATKKVHTVFADGMGTLKTADEAWARRGLPDPGDPGKHVVPMERVVGTGGETSVTVIVKPGTSRIVTAHPS